MFARFLCDESGFVISGELVVVATVGILALVCGLEAVSTMVASELTDVANAVGSLNQSYKIRSIYAVGGHASCSGSGFNDIHQTSSIGIGEEVAIAGTTQMQVLVQEELVPVDVVNVDAVTVATEEIAQEQLVIPVTPEIPVMEDCERLKLENARLRGLIEELCRTNAQTVPVQPVVPVPEIVLPVEPSADR